MHVWTIYIDGNNKYQQVLRKKLFQTIPIGRFSTVKGPNFQSTSIISIANICINKIL